MFVFGGPCHGSVGFPLHMLSIFVAAAGFSPSTRLAAILQAVFFFFFSPFLDSLLAAGWMEDGRSARCTGGGVLDPSGLTVFKSFLAR